MPRNGMRPVRGGSARCRSQANARASRPPRRVRLQSHGHFVIGVVCRQSPWSTTRRIDCVLAERWVHEGLRENEQLDFKAEHYDIFNAFGSVEVRALWADGAINTANVGTNDDLRRW